MDVVLGELAAERDAGCALEAERRLWNVLALLSPHVTTITTITAAATARTPASIAKVKWCAQAIARAFVYLLPYLRVRQTLAEEYFGLFCQRRSGGDAASNAPLPLRLGIVGILLTFQPALLSALRRQCTC
ncbi:hypothetical protein PTSG_11116 [Salpingoeca rosetta]|uniref:Uncharacterized protein n=1 Tax=Salpingoeca rosetta (strain ATCC 50818 / BSB-021) TaxID=946362 RepID=F2US69_SALR5|nr:uncharacterized protein PTSG_11116 [Salpingoeca rosetta]EGD80474.1 hypothetical protein PTSG_11116 [Salpingoeca rosetta]|eukprot:XP_004988038.1 hypothetical protein PTSG_11116 [Salpingoeca rosetta]